MSNHWIDINLEDCCKINYGRSPLAILSTDGAVPIYGTGVDKRFGTSHLGDGESIIIGRKGSIDKPIYVNGKFWAGDTTFYLSDFNETDVKWLYYFLSTINFRFLNESTGVPSLSRDALYKVAIHRPALKSEQSAIAHILSAVDEAIEHSQRLIAKYERIKTGLMQDLLTKGIDEQGRIRSEKTHRFKDSPLGRIPVEWELSKLSNVVNIFDCKHHTPEYVEEGIPVIRPRNIKETGLDFSDIDFATEEDYAFLIEKHQPKHGDILFSRNASFGVPCYVATHRRFAIGQDVVVMSKRDVNTKFIFYSLLSASSKNQIGIVSAGSTFGRINLAQIRSLTIKVPPSEEQLLIVKLAEGFEHAIHKQKDLLSIQHRVKVGLMHDLLNAKVRVPSAMLKGNQ